jgi:hypothetical protein
VIFGQGTGVFTILGVTLFKSCPCFPNEIEGLAGFLRRTTHSNLVQGDSSDQKRYLRSFDWGLQSSDTSILALTQIVNYGLTTGLENVMATHTAAPRSRRRRTIQRQSQKWSSKRTGGDRPVAAIRPQGLIIGIVISLTLWAVIFRLIQFIA